MADKDTALAILQAAIALAGLLLVFIGFLLSKADQTDLKAPRQRIRRIVGAGLIPFVAALGCSWQSIWVLQGAHLSAAYLYSTLKIVLVLVGLYAIMATFFEVRERRR
jgi:hypothetical protein